MNARRILGVIAIALSSMTGCATPRGDAERIVETATGRTVTRGEFVEVLRSSDFVLLGELHDNPLHHRRRGELIAELGSGAAVIAEQMTAGRSVAPQGELLPALMAAGFDPTGWAWPLHEPLFDAVRRGGLSLAGGNVERDAARRIARQGEAALDAGSAALLRAAPLPAAAQAALDDDLQAGHCGQLRPDVLGRLRLAQRARDAAMAQALQHAGGRPSVLVAGNGHVRRDYGVAPLLAALQPGARVVSVGFLDGDASAEPQAYTYVWRTPAPSRDDPCEKLAMPR